MKQKHIIIGTMILLSVISIAPTTLYAEESTPRERAEGTRPPRQNVPPFEQRRLETQKLLQERKDIFEENKADFKETQQALREDRQEDRLDWQPGDAKENRADAREVHKALREDRQADRLEFRDDWNAHRLEVKERFGEQKELFKMRLASSTDAIKTRFVGEKKAFIEQRLDTMYTRFDGVAQKLINLADKIQTRIDALETEGKDVADVTTKLSDAKDAIAHAEALIVETKTALDESLANQTEVSREGIRALIQETKTALVDARQALASVIELLKTI